VAYRSHHTPKTFRQPCSTVAHVVSQTTVIGQATAPEGDATLKSPSAVLCDSLTRRSRPTLLSGSVGQIGCRRRDAARTGARQAHSRRLRAVEITRRVSDTAGSRIQPGAPRYDARSDSHCGEAFSPLAQPQAPAGQGPTPASVGIHHGQPERTAVACLGS